MSKTKSKPQRTCIICRNKHDKRDLLRIVRDKSGHISFDPTGKKNGRGAYICTSPDCIDTFFKKSTLERAFRSKIPAEDVEEVREQVGAYLENSNRADSEAEVMN